MASLPPKRWPSLQMWQLPLWQQATPRSGSEDVRTRRSRPSPYSEVSLGAASCQLSWPMPIGTGTDGAACHARKLRGAPDTGTFAIFEPSISVVTSVAVIQGEAHQGA